MSDTIYVYEEVVVHDTVYLEKPFDKIKIDKIIVTPEKNGNKPQLTIIQENKKTSIAADSLIIERKSFPWNFGAKLLLGFHSNSLFKEFNKKVQPYFGLGIFVKKTLFHPDFSIGTGFETSFSTSNFNLDATQNESSLNGYYFTDDGSPKLFNSITNKGFQFQIPLQVYWRIKKYTPSVGVFGNISNYKSTFIGSSGALPLVFDETQTYTAKAFYLGYLVQLEYQISNKWSAAINYSFANAKKLAFKGNGGSFGIDNKIHENSFGVDLLYHF